MNRRFQFAVIFSSTCLVVLLLFGTVREVRSAAPDDPYVQLGVFSDVLTKIQVEYVEEPDMKAVTVGAINGLLENLDPFASYLNKAQYEQYQKEYKADRPSVGVMLARGPGYLRIVDAAPGSPAAGVGLTTGDVIESINGVSTRDMPLAFADLLLEGDAGSEVKMSVLTPRNSDPQELTVKRAAISYPAVKSRVLTDRSEPVGVITVASLREGMVAQVSQAARNLEQQGAKKLILDLRYCADGPMQDGVTLADLFMDDGLIGYTQGQRSRRQDFRASSARTVSHLPLTVLTNRGTAGPAEIAAAALLESQRAQVVGEPTFGNASVREAVKLPDGGAIILATAKYYGPKGKAIQDTKVVPPILQGQFAPTSDTDEGATPEPARPEDDPILKRGLDFPPIITPESSGVSRSK